MRDTEYILLPLLSRAGEVVGHAMIDTVDSAQAAYVWRLHSRGYASRGVTRDGRRVTLLLHREILGLGSGNPMQGDHVSRNRLDCRRSNLRGITHALNTQNVGSAHGSTSRYRGVSWDKRKLKWYAKGQVGGRQYGLGYFSREEDAAAAASAFRVEHMPCAVEV